MRFTKDLLEQIEKIEDAGKFLVYCLLCMLGVSLLVLFIIAWALKSRFL
jgi:hypothetical protein